MNDCFGDDEITQPPMEHDEGCMRPVREPQQEIVPTSVEEQQWNVSQSHGAKAIRNTCDELSLTPIEGP